MSKHKGEKCMRCGEYGEDRRTLWMACFYEMDELKLPFEKKILFHTDIAHLKGAKDPLAIDLGGGAKINLQAGTVTTAAELTPQKFYTMRVCKACRADWMQWIQTWFFLTKQHKPGCTGAFRRYHGATVEMTQEEVEAFEKELGHAPIKLVESCKEHSCLRCEKFPWKPTRKEAKHCKQCPNPCIHVNRI